MLHIDDTGLCQLLGYYNKNKNKIIKGYVQDGKVSYRINEETY